MFALHLAVNFDVDRRRSQERFSISAANALGWDNEDNDDTCGACAFDPKAIPCFLANANI